MDEPGTSESANASGTDIGQQMYALLADLFPICRSITGDGVRQTLRILKKYIPIEIHEVPTGTNVFDWVVPREWNIRDAFIEDEYGNRIIDFKRNNLHVVGYSVPVDRWVSLTELQQHLYSREDQPDAIPYVTSYYEERWGFCIAHSQRVTLKGNRYRVYIDSDLKDGHLTYGECIIPGAVEKEVFLSTYICHPSMANNELSGPAVATFVGQWIASRPRRYTHRIVFVPETIGAITYLDRHLDHLKKNVVVGFNLTCLGDERTYSVVSSRYADTLADKIASNVLSFRHPNYIKYSFLNRGSDERQYCSPGVDLPLVTLCRSKFREFPEFHTSLDNLDLVTPDGLKGSYEMVQDCIRAVEYNKTYRVDCHGEPQLGKRGLYPKMRMKKLKAPVQAMMDFIAYADATNDLLDISNLIGVPLWELYPIVDKLVEAGIIVDTDDENPS